MAAGIDDQLKQINALPNDEFWQQHPLPADLYFDDNPVHLTSWDTISKADLAHCFHLLDATSSPLYRSSVFGWHPRSKRAEMRKTGMRYLLVRPAPQPPTETSDPRPPTLVGFLSFLPLIEDGAPPAAPFLALYVYEIHVDPLWQSRGVGRRLLRAAEGIAGGMGARKVMLTVFEANERGRRFYAREGYGVDASSPSEGEMAGWKAEVAAERGGLGAGRRLRSRKEVEEEEEGQGEVDIGGYLIMSKMVTKMG